MRQFAKYEALGNDYLVLDPSTWDVPLNPARVRRLCDRHFGLGSDGILWGPEAVAESPGRWRLRIFNPDGSEAEKSGNGLRIFARYLLDRGLVRCDQPFVVCTAGGDVECCVREGGRSVHVAMGRVSFASRAIPVTGPDREVLNEHIDVGGVTVRFCAATVGNPHCVVLDQPVDAATAQRLGPLLETHPLFPNRTNVQFLEVVDRRTIRIEIWERGAGYTLASGSSSSAAAAVARRLGLCGPDVRVVMPGGDLRIEIDDRFGITMTGPVAAVAAGSAANDLVAALLALV